MACLTMLSVAASEMTIVEWWIRNDMEGSGETKESQDRRQSRIIRLWIGIRTRCLQST
jgi:hypothetical protein